MTNSIFVRPGSKPTPVVFPPGEWVLSVFASGGKAIATVSLGSGDEITTTLVLTPGRRMSGRVVFNGSTPPPPGGVTLDVRAAGNLNLKTTFSRTGPAKTNPDGTFEITGLAGRVLLGLAAPVPGWTLASAMYNGRDLSDTPVDFDGNEDISGVEVVLTDSVPELSGTTVQPDGTAARGCTVMFFPEPRELAFNSRRTRLLRSDQNGRFSIVEVPEGAYFIAATSDVEASTWLTEDYLDFLRPRATRVVLKGRDRQAVTLACASAL
jgi:hypothetical protein